MPFASGVFVHSFSSLFYDRSKASSKASSPHSAIQSFLLQMRVSSPFLKVIQQLPTSSSLSSCHFYPPLYLFFSNPLQKAVSTQNVTNPVCLPFTYFMQSLLLSIKQSKGFIHLYYFRFILIWDTCVSRQDLNITRICKDRSDSNVIYKAASLFVCLFVPYTNPHF